MKKLLAIITLVGAISTASQAQISSNLLTDLGKVGSDFGSFFTDSVGQTNWGVTVGGLYSDSAWGLFGDVQYQLNSFSSIGFLSSYIPDAYKGADGKNHGTFYDGSLGFKIGSTVKLPLIGTIGYYAESGPGYSFTSHQAIAQSFAGLVKDITLSGKFHLILGGGVGNISDRSGVAYVAHATFTW